MDHSQHDHGGASKPGGDLIGGSSNPACEVMMPMYLHWDLRNKCLLFATWRIGSAAAVAGAIIATAALSFLFEIARYRLIAWDAAPTKLPPLLPPAFDEKSESRATRGKHWRRIVSAAAHGIVTIWGYLLMIVAMLLNVPLILALALGAALGKLAVMYAGKPRHIAQPAAGGCH
ncbi:hypothetical protein GQ42DRAFT_179531 [Ramicandelaber brevisporus]|nr:hypothetical protein GQ42DRAFT_179531 [Ramicandelaber brevisporus]